MISPSAHLSVDDLFQRLSKLDEKTDSSPCSDDGEELEDNSCKGSFMLPPSRKVGINVSLNSAFEAVRSDLSK